MCPLIPLNAVVYFENDHFCYASFTNIPGILWAAFAAYILPVCCLFIIYIVITRFIHHQGNNQTLAIKKRQTRDLLVIRRIMIIVSLLLLVGIPAMVVLLIFIITGKEQPLVFRIAPLPVSVSVSRVSVALIFCIPQLKSIALKLWQVHLVAPLYAALLGTIQMRTIVSTT
jgi:hypothetical protein